MGTEWIERAAASLNYRAGDIGLPGAAGFGVGVCPPANLPPGFTPMAGYTEPASPNYGNYIYADGSFMVFVPKFYYKFGTGANGVNLNTVDIKGIYDFTDTTAANAAGYALHRAFIDGGVETPGFFVDKYMASRNAKGTGWVGSSLPNGLPLSSDPAHNPMWLSQIPWTADTVIALNTFRTPTVANGYAYECTARAGDFKTDPALEPAWPTIIGNTVVDDQITWTCRAYVGLTSCTGNYYHQAINAAHARDGVNGAINANSIFFVTSRFIYGALALLSLAQQSGSDGWCAWFDLKPYPKGCNNNALRDTDDASVLYQSDGYSNCGKTGSGVPFAKTTHNGQVCGIADLNGLMYEISLGVTCIAAPKTITGASKANPCVITIAGHGYTTGDILLIASVGGMTQLNDKLYTITLDGGDPTNKFSLNGVDSSGYTDFTTGGSCTKGSFYAAKPATAMKAFTPGNSLATDHWGATGVAAMMDAISLPLKAASGGTAIAQRFGSGANQVLSEAVSGAGWLLSGLGLPRDTNAFDGTGTDPFGKDYFYQYIRNELCLLSCANWGNTSGAGVWSAYLAYGRAYATDSTGWRCACYPV